MVPGARMKHEAALQSHAMGARDQQTFALGASSACLSQFYVIRRVLMFAKPCLFTHRGSCINQRWPGSNQPLDLAASKQQRKATCSTSIITSTMAITITTIIITSSSVMISNLITSSSSSRGGPLGQQGCLAE